MNTGHTVCAVYLQCICTNEYCVHAVFARQNMSVGQRYPVTCASTRALLSARDRPHCFISETLTSLKLWLETKRSWYKFHHKCRREDTHKQAWANMVKILTDTEMA